MKSFAYIIAALMLVILLQFIVSKCDHRKHEREISQYAAALDSCISAEPQRDTLWLFRTLRDTVRLAIREYSVAKIDTICDTITIETREYTGIYRNDMLAVRWRAVVFGKLESIEILPTSSYRYPQITNTRVVTLPARECDPVRVGRERARLYFNPEIYWGDDAVFRASLLYIHPRGWGLSGAVQTAFESNHLYYGGGFVVRIK